MKIIYNRLLPVKGFAAITLFGMIFARREFRPLTERTIRHENIHKAQAHDHGRWFWAWIVFHLKYLWYCAWFGYTANPFEKEAYMWDFDEDYLLRRPSPRRWPWSIKKVNDLILS